MNYLIIFQSATQAQNAVSILSRNGIQSSVTKPPLFLGKGSCSHGIRVVSNDYNRARALLKGLRTQSMGAYRINGQGSYEGVAF